MAHSMAAKPPRRAKVSARAERVPHSERHECSTSHMIPLPMVVRSAFSLRPGPSFGGARHEGSPAPDAHGLEVEDAGPAGHFRQRHQDEGGDPRLTRSDVVQSAETLDRRPAAIAQPEREGHAGADAEHPEHRRCRTCLGEGGPAHRADTGDEASQEPQYRARTKQSGLKQQVVASCGDSGEELRRRPKRHGDRHHQTDDGDLVPPDLQDNQSDKGDVH